MPEIKISQLPEVTNVILGDVLPVVASGVTSKIQIQNFGVSITSSNSVSSSYSLQSLSSSFSNTSSYSLNSISSSYAITASSADNFLVRQNLTASNGLFTGTITAQTLVVQTVTSSVIYSSGSNIFGNKITDVQQFTGSVNITGSLSIIGPATINSLTGSLFGTSSWALNVLTASYIQTAQTASYVQLAQSASYILQAVSSSFASTASYVTGSVFNFFNPALSASYALTASYALNSGNVSTSTFPYTGSAIITGSLVITGSLSNGDSSIKAIGPFSHVEGRFSIASGSYSHAEGDGAEARGYASHAEGESTFAFGDRSHTEGSSTTAYGQASHAEGTSTEASGDFSHAEGSGTIASGSNSHAEGVSSVAIGDGAHAEGYLTLAEKDGSHAEGLYTVASGFYQHVQGQYNQSSSIQSAFIVGNGIGVSNRSNLIFAAGNIVQVTGSVIATAGFSGSLFGTSSWALNALTASYALNAGGTAGVTVADEGTTQGTATFLNFTGTGVTATVTSNTASITINLGGNSFPYTGSAQITGSLGITGSVSTTEGFTGSLFGTASWAINVVNGNSGTFPYNGDAVITGSLLLTNQTNSVLFKPFSNLDVDTGTEVVASLSTASYDAVFFDYVAKDGTNYRAGTVIGVWSNTTWSYTDTSVTDIGNTSGLIMDMDIDSGNVRLKATVNSNNWIIKTFTRVI